MIRGKYWIMIWAFNNFCRKKSMCVIIFPCSLPKRWVRFLALPLMQSIQLRELNCKRKEEWALNGTHGSHVPHGCLAVLHFPVLHGAKLFVHIDLWDELLVDLHLNHWLLWGCLQRNGVTSVTCMAWKKMTCREGRTRQAGLYRRGNASKTHSPHSQQ